MCICWLGVYKKKKTGKQTVVTVSGKADKLTIRSAICLYWLNSSLSQWSSGTHFWFFPTQNYIDIKETNAWTRSLTVVVASITEQIMTLTQVGALAGKGGRWGGVGGCCYCSLVGGEIAIHYAGKAKAQRSMELGPHLSQFCKSRIDKCWFLQGNSGWKRHVFPSRKM